LPDNSAKIQRKVIPWNIERFRFIRTFAAKEQTVPRPAARGGRSSSMKPLTNTSGRIMIPWSGNYGGTLPGTKICTIYARDERDVPCRIPQDCAVCS
jgi:hypothetical protein